MQEEFFQAIASGDQPKLAALLADDSDLLLATMPSGISGVMWAAYTQQPDNATFLIDHGAPVTLHEAAALGVLPVLEQRLTTIPAQVNSFSVDGFTALGLAAFFGHEAAVVMLLAHGADPNLASQNTQQVAPIHSAVAHRHARIVELLIARGADVDARQEQDFTPLQEAAHNGDITSARILIAAGATVNLRNQQGKTALAFANEHGSKAMQELLLQQNATL